MTENKVLVTCRHCGMDFTAEAGLNGVCCPFCGTSVAADGSPTGPDNAGTDHAYPAPESETVRRFLSLMEIEERKSAEVLKNLREQPVPGGSPEGGAKTGDLPELTPEQKKRRLIRLMLTVILIDAGVAVIAATFISGVGGLSVFGFLSLMAAGWIWLFPVLKARGVIDKAKNSVDSARGRAKTRSDLRQAKKELELRELQNKLNNGQNTSSEAAAQPAAQQEQNARQPLQEPARPQNTFVPQQPQQGFSQKGTYYEEPFHYDGGYAARSQQAGRGGTTAPPYYDRSQTDRSGEYRFDSRAGQDRMPHSGKAPKNKWVALFLCVFMGFLGAHKFYEEKIVIGVIYLLTGGLFGIGVIFDALSILFKKDTNYYP